MTRKVVLWMQQSVDGYVEGPDGAFDWPVVRPALVRSFNAVAREMGAFLYGRRTWEMMVGFWPTADVDPDMPETAEYAGIWKPMPKVVFSRTLDDLGWNARVVSDDIAGEVAALKAQPGGDLVLFGGAEIASTFLRLDLVDEYRLFVHPVVLGGGTRLFPPLDGRARQRLVESEVFDGGVVHLHYERQESPA